MIEMKTNKLACSFHAFDKLNSASLAAAVEKEPDEMRNLAMQYRMYAKCANQDVKFLSKNYHKALSLMFEYKERAEGAEQALALMREMNVLGMQFDILRSRWQALKLKITELDSQCAHL
jgi:hypothetical protein